MLGSTARIGLVVPANNTVIEPELYGIGLDGVSFHFARAIGSRAGMSSVEGLKTIVDEAERAIEALAIAGVDIVVYACLSTSLFNDDWESRFVERVRSVAGVPSFTAFEAMLAEIRRHEPRSLALLDPYGPAIHERLEPALRERGLTSIAGSHSMNLPGLQQVCRTPPDMIVDAVRELVTVTVRDADTVAIFATDLQTMEVLPRMNAEFARPVISTNQAIISEVAARLSLALPPLGPPMRTA